MSHILKIRIYYEDTDCGGVVYYANYLRYVERARTEFLEARGVSLRALMDEGVYFVVAEAALKYVSPGRYGDILKVETDVERVGTASIVFRHAISRDLSGEKLVEATVKLGCVGRDMKPLRLRQNSLDAVTKSEGISRTA
jgi:acyl-CoA thioester hydrolase